MASTRGFAAASLVLALATCGSIPSAAVAIEITVERLAPADPAAIVYPGQEPGAWRSWVQLVWDPVTAKLVRRTYTVFDPIPSLDLDLVWQPADPTTDAAGRITGEGMLTFRINGAPTYDPQAAVAQYRGELVDGRPQGDGEFLHVSGFAYSGEWHQGLMDGDGRLSLPNGDQYAGSFEAGRRQGEGVYIDAVGVVYDGRFAADQRDGLGIVMAPDGAAYAASWIMGEEVTGSRSAVDSGPAQVIDAQYQTYDDLRLGVVAERRPVMQDLGVTPLGYTSDSAGDVLKIYPDDERLLGVWRGTEPIQLIGDEDAAFYDSMLQPGFLGSQQRFTPMALVFELENISTADVAVVGAYLEVTRSQREPEPAIQLRHDFGMRCSAGEPAFVPTFSLDNLGWTDATGAELTFSFATPDGEARSEAFTLPIGDIEQRSDVDLRAELEALGVNATMLESETLVCTDLSNTQQCLGELRDSGTFGGLADYLSLEQNDIVVNTEGSLEYDWVDDAGASHHKSSPFANELLVGVVRIEVEEECGEGGETMVPDHDPFRFELDGSDYRVGIPLDDQVAAGQTGRWRIQLAAEQTSTHDFRLVLLLADGREVASRPVELLYFMPRPASTGY